MNAYIKWFKKDWPTAPTPPFSKVKEREFL